MRRSLSLLLASLLTPLAALAAPETFLEQYAATNRFRLGRPAAVTPTPDGAQVLFLRSGPRSFTRDLWALDVQSGEAKVVLTADSILKGAEEKLTAEEKARRERLRLAAKGLASFELSRDGRRVLVPLSGKLYVVERATGAVTLLPSEGGAPLDARFSPDGAYVSCVREGELFVIDVAKKSQKRLTDRKGRAVQFGVAEFVAQEEMDRHEGHGWSPDGKQLWFTEVDEAKVEKLYVGDPLHPEVAPEPWPYPRAGRTNATVKLFVVAAAGGAPKEIGWELQKFPYLARIVWGKGAPLTLVVQDRAQQRQLVLAADVATGKTRTLLEDRDDAWLNLPDELPRWLPDGSGFLWPSEASGETRLVLYGKDGAKLRELGAPGQGLRSFVGLDERRGAAVVLASPEPAEQHVLRLPLQGGAGEALTTGVATHGAALGDDGTLVLLRDAPAEAPSARVLRADGAQGPLVPSTAEAPPMLPNLELTKVTITADGKPLELAAGLLRPRSFQPGRRYPVVLSVYGGPMAKTVEAGRDRWLMNQWLADQGVIVVSIDGRGTPGRGRAFERAIRERLLEVPLHDQVAGLQALGKRFPELDLSNVGVYGWSFGGTLAAYAVLQRPDVFSRAVSGAPVTDWHDYDTHYTERYLGLPDVNAKAYADASPVTFAGKLSRPLLLVHGTADDNVYFLHALKLSGALFLAGKPHEFLPLSGFTHMVVTPETTSRLYGRIADFLLQRPPPR